MSDPMPPVAKEHYRGDLSQTPLPEVLVTIHKYKAPGVVECVRENETKRIYIENGNIIFATSSNVGDSLGVRLLKQEKITRDQYEESVQRLITSEGKRQGTILVEMKAIEPKDLFISVREQVQEIVWSIFEWEQGTVTFVPGRERHLEFIKLNIPTRQAVLQGVCRIKDARSLVARMGNRVTVLQQNTDADLHDLTLTPEEQNLLTHVDGKHTLLDLTKIPPMSAVDNAKILYAFFALKLISVKLPKQIKVQIKTDRAEQ